jgi:hypothetical protein
MGWLRDLMRARQPPIRSFDALARAAIARPDWPSGSRLQPRSLAALLSRLDRDVGLEWLREREQIQTLLADLLGCPTSDLQAAASENTRSLAPSERRLRLDDVPYARSLDLSSESLFPGIPRLVLEPETWRRLWWIAPSGAGRTIVGQWLAARSRAIFVNAPGARSVVEADLTHGPLFVEVRSPADAWPSWPSDRLCVAAPFSPGSGWDVVTTPPASEYARELVDWVAARLPADGNFPPARVSAWLEAGPITEGWVDGPGTLLGLTGAIDQLGAKALERTNSRELARRFLLYRAAAMERRGDADGAWLRRHGWNVLKALVRRALTDAEAGWDVPRTREQWLDLVPPEYQREVDLDWLRVSLGDGSSALRRSDLERAARRLPPGAYRIIRALINAGLLCSTGTADQLTFRPRWLMIVLSREVLTELVRASPSEWGEALLRPHAALSVADELLARAEREDLGLIEDVLELDADQNPAHVAAVEAVFTVVGVALLLGAEFPDDLLAALVAEQLGLAVPSVGNPPSRRIGHPTAPPESLLGRSTWVLSALALTEGLLPRGPGPYGGLLPWSGAASPGLLSAMLDQVLPGLAHGRAPPRWAKAALGLVDRLRATVGRAAADWHPLERPGAILEEVEHEVLSWETIAGLERDVALVDLLEELAQARGQAWPDVARAIWHAWSESSGEIETTPLMAHHQPWARRLWAHIPCGVVMTLLERSPRAVLLDHLDDEHWAQLLAAPPARLSPAGMRVLWQSLPAKHWTAAWSVLPPSDPEVLAELWRKAPAWVLGKVGELGQARDWHGLVLLLTQAPDDQTAACVAIGEQLPMGSIPDQTVSELVAWLRRRVAHRVPDWRRAYGYLAELERSLHFAQRGS